MDWSDEVIERLRAFWAEGHSTAEIGRRLGVTKNAVVGKVHRLSLTPRPSPIQRGAPGAAPRNAPPPLAPMAQPVPEMIVPPPPRPQAAPLRPVSRTAGGRVIPCCWPIGEPGTRSFHFCDADSAAGKPYCMHHAALAYVKVRDRREDAA